MSYYKAVIEGTSREKTTQLLGPSLLALTETLKEEFRRQKKEHPGAVLRVYRLKEELVEEITEEY